MLHHDDGVPVTDKFSKQGQQLFHVVCVKAGAGLVQYQKLLTSEIVSCLAQIDEQKGQQNLFIEAHKDALSELLEIAKMLLPLRSCFQHSRKPLPAGIAALVLPAHLPQRKSDLQSQENKSSVVITF